MQSYDYDYGWTEEETQCFEPDLPQQVRLYIKM